MEHDAVVIGAGIAGLSAALHLVEAGLSVSLLEASDGVGGRVRTDLVDGWRLDRGFQVHDTAYPTLAGMLDADALQLRDFSPGAVVHNGGREFRVMDPRRRPLDLLNTARAPIGSLLDKAKIALLAVRLLRTPVPALLEETEMSTWAYLRDAGISEASIDAFWRPYLSGVFLESDLDTSSRFFALVLRSQARGAQCVPAAGIGAIPDQLAARLPAGVLQLGTPVESLDAVDARAIVVATDPRTAARLLPELGAPPRLQKGTTMYFAAPFFSTEPVIHIEGQGRAIGPIANAVVIPGDQPGRLLAVTSLGAPSIDAVRAHLGRWFGTIADSWDLLATYAYETVHMTVPQGNFRRDVDLGDGIYVCGDHRDSASTQGAAVSGRRAARAVIAALA